MKFSYWFYCDRDYTNQWWFAIWPVDMNLGTVGLRICGFTFKIQTPDPYLQDDEDDKV